LRKYGRRSGTSTINLTDQKTWELNLKKKEMQMRKALIVGKVKWKKLSRRCEIPRL